MVDDAEAAEEKEEDEAAGYRIKNKNPTQRCGEKTKQFCEIDNIKNEAILGNFLQKWKVECRADGLVPTCFAIFPLHLSTVPRLPRKSEAGSYECCTFAQNYLGKPEDLTLQNATLSGNLRPDLLTSLMNTSLALRLPREMHLSRSVSNVPRLPKLLKLLQKTPRFARFWQGTESPAPAMRNHVLTSKSGPRPSPSKSAPKLVCFARFDLEMCFAPKGLQTRQFLTLLTSNCASRHNGVQFFISHPARWLRTRRFSKPTFRPPGATKIIGKT